ncbi:MAG: HAD family hydrolase [candidate division Zixibacteria bacterium]|nr:HAD family hydrolase [candidate division Zixibacteria bacterium]
MQHRALFLDRDGTINIERGFISNPDDVQLISGAAEGLFLAGTHGFKLFVISNQSGVARGLMTEDDVVQVNQRLTELLAREGVALDGIEYCPHYPSLSGPCDCRKPQRGMIDRVLRRHDINLARSFVIGDRALDRELALNIGAKAIMVMTGYGVLEVNALNPDRKPDYVARDLLSAVQWILEHE